MISCTLSVFTTDICPPIAVYAITMIEVMTNIILLLFPSANVIREFIATSCPAITPTHDITMISEIMTSARRPTILAARSGSVSALILLTFSDKNSDCNMSPMAPNASHQIPGNPML